MKKKRQKKPKGQLVILLIGMLTGVVDALFILDYIFTVVGFDIPFSRFMLIYVLLFAGMILIVHVQTIIHEVGHLVFGLASGYRLVSFRVGGLMWVKTEEGLRLHRLSLAGTGGQCLMEPPEPVDGKLPFVLYNMGGSLMNLISALLFSALAFLPGRDSMGTVLLKMLAVGGLGTSLSNGLPLRTSTINSDGSNTLELRRSKDAARGFWVQLKVNSAQARGLWLKEMPEDWFRLPDREAMKGSLAASVGVMAAVRLMEQERFYEAEVLMERLLTEATGTVGVHRGRLGCDRICCELLTENRPERLAALLDKEQTRQMTVLRRQLSTLRTWYMLALLRDGDREKAEKYRTQFEKLAKNYPYPAELDSERRLIALADEKYKEEHP